MSTQNEQEVLKEDIIPALAKRCTANWVRQVARQPHLANSSVSTYAIRLTEETIGIALESYKYEAEHSFKNRLESQRADYEKKIAELQEKLKAKQGRPKK